MTRSKYGPDWPKFSNMTWLRLNEGPGDAVEIDIAPTMKFLTHQGERYFRMENTRAHREDGSKGGAYLWEQYWDVRLGRETADDPRRSGRGAVPDPD